MSYKSGSYSSLPIRIYSLLFTAKRFQSCRLYPGLTSQVPVSFTLGDEEKNEEKKIAVLTTAKTFAAFLLSIVYIICRLGTEVDPYRERLYCARGLEHGQGRWVSRSVYKLPLYFVNKENECPPLKELQGLQYNKYSALSVLQWLVNRHFEFGEQIFNMFIRLPGN